MTYALTGIGKFVTTGDFNRDGKLDLAVAGGAGGTASVAVLLGNGDGTFQKAVAYHAGSDPAWVAVGDFNGDGKPDLAVTNPLGRSLAILTGNGDGTFKAPVSVAAGFTPLSVAVADFNGDGKLDLAVADGSNSAGSVSILLGTGNGSFQAPVSYGTGVATCVVIGDFNGDRKLDLALGNYSYDAVSILLGAGDGTFAPQVNYRVHGKPTSLAIADFNGDGKPDLASDTGDILPGNGDGTFGPWVRFYVPLGPDFVVAGDFNADGKQDLAVSGAERPYGVVILLGRGSAIFPHPVNVSVPGVSSVTAGDFNGDGNPDLAVTNAATVSILLGKGNGTFQPPVNYTAGGLPFAVATGDFNRDGKLDLAVANAGLAGAPTGSVSILLGNGDGTFQAALNFDVPYGANDIAVADFNGDGNPDVVVTSGAFLGNLVAVMLGRGDGTLTPAVSYALNYSVYAVIAADFSGDGKPDLAVTDGDLIILLGNGDGTFHLPVTYSGAGGGALAAGDINGDGKLDIALCCGGILLGNGDGTFQKSPVVLSVNGSAVAIKDFNGDGKPDLAYVNSYNASSTNSVSVFMGNGDGIFQPAIDFVVGNLPGSIAVGDFNRDGKPDLAVGVVSAVTILTNTTR